MPDLASEFKNRIFNLFNSLLSERNLDDVVSEIDGKFIEKIIRKGKLESFSRLVEILIKEISMLEEPEATKILKNC